MEAIVVEAGCLILVLIAAVTSLQRRSLIGLIGTAVLCALSAMASGYMSFGNIGAVVGAVASLFAALGAYEMLGIVQTWAAENFIFTSLEEGRAAAVVSGQGLWRMVMQYSGHEYIGNTGSDPIDAWEVVPSGHRHPWTESWEWLKGLLGLSGIRLIGWPGWHSLYWYRFTWASMEQNKDGTIGKLIFHPAEVMYHIYVKPDSYAVTVTSAEDINGVALRGAATLVIQIVNPAKALFRVEKWLEMTQALLVPRIRQWIGSVEGGWRQLQQKKSHDLTAIVAHTSDAVAVPAENGDDNMTIKSMLEDQYGVRIISIQLLNLDPDGEEETVRNIRAAATAPYVATQTADATVIAAEATKKKLRIEAEGQAAATRLGGEAERDRIHEIATEARASDAGLEILRQDTLRAMAGGAGTTFVIPEQVTSLLGSLAKGGNKKPPRRVENRNQERKE